MVSYLWLLLLISVGSTANVVNTGIQRFAMEPQDQTAIVGSKVTLPCRVESKIGQLQWTKDDFGLGWHRNLSGFDRYSMIGSDEEGDYSLEIYPVMLDDEARYQCQVSPGKDGKFCCLKVIRFGALHVSFTSQERPVCDHVLQP